MMNLVSKYAPRPVKRLGKRVLGRESAAPPPRYGDPNSVLLVGPWLGEVGSELQYWIPFLQRLQRDDRLEYRKLIAISRGGTETWYRHIADEYVEVFDHQDARVQVEKMARREGLKQAILSQEELELVSSIAESIGSTNYQTLHPAIMWAEIVDWVKDRISMDEATGKLDFRMYPAPSQKYARLVDEMNLPSEFYAVKFYINDSFPGTQQNLELVQDVVSRISSDHYVVDLGMPIRVDDHVTIGLKVSERVIPAGARFELHSNLGVQTEIIRRSKGLIGTNGGLSILPAFVGVPSLSFYSEPRMKFGPNLFQHESMALRLYETLANQSYMVMSTEDWQYVRQMFWS